MTVASIRSATDTAAHVGIDLLFLAAILVAAGALLYQWLRGRRPRVVLDVEVDKGIPSEATTGLATHLRREVRRALQQQDEYVHHSQPKTIEADIRQGLVNVQAARLLSIGAVELTTTRNVNESVGALIAGLAAVAPKEAAVVTTLRSLLPTERGWRVCSCPVLRGCGSSAEVGLTVEMSAFGSVPDAGTTFWTSSPTLQNLSSATLQDPSREGAQSAAIRDLLYKLVQPASAWIAIRLVSRWILDQENERRSWRSDLKRRDASELKGLQLQLAGQLQLYFTKERPEFSEGFVGAAMEDLAAAATLLKDYFRPHYTRGAMYETRAWSFRKSGDNEYAGSLFRTAIDYYDRSEELLKQKGTEGAARTATGIKLRRTKCRLLTGKDAEIQVAARELTDFDSLNSTTWDADRLNWAACLCAIAMQEPSFSEQRPAHELRAWQYLGRSLLVGGRQHPVWASVTWDEELAGLNVNLRKRLRDEAEQCLDGLAALSDPEARQEVARQEVDDLLQRCAIDVSAPARAA